MAFLCRKRIDDIRTREKKRNRKPKELEGLVPLVEEKKGFFEKVVSDVSDRLHEYLFRNYRVTWRRLSRGAYLISMYTDQHGDVVDLFRRLQIVEEDQLLWLEFWEELDENADNKMEYAEFLDAFGLEDNLYTLRFYDVVNTSLTGYVSFKEFISTVWNYLVNDQQETLKLGFRLMSRLGTDFKADKSVLDITDLRDFLSYRYPGIDEKSLLRRARALYFHIVGANNTVSGGGIDYQTWCTYCYQDEPLLMVYTSTLQQLMRRRLFGEWYWEGLTKSRGAMYMYDVVLERRIKDVLKRENDRKKEKAKEDFTKDFPKVAKKFRNDKASKGAHDKLKKNMSWQLAQATRDRVVRLLENLEGDRRYLWWNFKRWRRNVGMGRTPVKDDDKDKEDKSHIQQPEKPLQTADSKEKKSGFFSFVGWGSKGTKVAAAAGGSITKGGDKIGQAPRQQTSSSVEFADDKTNNRGSSGNEDGEDNREETMARRYSRVASRRLSAFSENELQEAMKNDIYRKILDREERSRLTQSDLLDQYLEEWQCSVHKREVPLPTLEEITWLKSLLIHRDDEHPLREEEKEETSSPGSSGEEKRTLGCDLTRALTASPATRTQGRDPDQVDMKEGEFRKFWAAVREELGNASWARKLPNDGSIVIIKIQGGGRGGVVSVVGGPEGKSLDGADDERAFYTLDISLAVLAAFEGEICDYNEVEDFAHDFVVAVRGSGTVGLIDDGLESGGVSLSLIFEEVEGKGKLPLRLVHRGVSLQLLKTIEPFFDFDRQTGIATRPETQDPSPEEKKKGGSATKNKDKQRAVKQEDGDSGDGSGDKSGEEVDKAKVFKHKRRKVIGGNISFKGEGSP